MTISSNRRHFLAAAAGAACLSNSSHAAMNRHPEPAKEEADTEIPFSLGIVTYNVAAEWDLSTILEVLPRVGIHHVEFRTTHRHGVETSLSKAQRKEVRQRCADAGVTIWGLGSVCEFHSADPAVVTQNIETCREFLELAHDLGAAGVKVRPNGLRKDVPEEQSLKQIGEALIPCGKAAADLGCEVWVEVHGSQTAKPPRMKSIMEHCGHESVGICWNSNRDDIVDGSIQSSFEMLSPWLKSCHINALYSGYPYRQLFRNLRSIGYNRVTLIEIGEKPDPKNGELLLRYYHQLWKELCR